MRDDMLLDGDQGNIEDEDDFGSKVAEYDNLSLTASDWTIETLFGQIDKGNIEQFRFWSWRRITFG